MMEDRTNRNKNRNPVGSEPVQHGRRLTVVGKNGLVLNFFRHMEQVYVPKNRMKDMSVMSGTKSQDFPTSSPLYFKQSALVSDDQVAFIGCIQTQGIKTPI